MRRWFLWLLFAACGLAVAGVPNERAEPAYAEEQTLLQLEQGLATPGLLDRASGIEHMDRHGVVMPGRQPEYDVILQRGGNTWRTWRNGPLATLVGTLLALTLVTLAAYHALHGPLEEPVAGGPKLLRFTRARRWIHWATAIAFVVLALTGLVVLFGKLVLLPWMGHEVFSWIAIASKWLHNVAGPVFIVCSLAMFVVFLRDNHFERVDWIWVKRAGGLFGRGHVPAPYFNAGEKLWFWLGVTGLGLLMAATGLLMDFPYSGEVGAVIGLTRYQLQVANVLHLVGAAFYLAAALAHIYLGTLGSPGAWQAMAHGSVDAGWAKAHHEIWHDRVMASRGDGAAR